MGRSIVGVCLGLFVRVWLATLRVRVEVHEELARTGNRAWILGFLHGTQWPLLAWKRRRGTAVLVSLSKDGAIQSRVLSILGLVVIRGSSSRGGAKGLKALVGRVSAERLDAAFAIDGPRGPYGVAKPGVVLAARACGGLIVPMAGIAKRGITLSRTWDRFRIAWPFTRVTVRLGAPIDPCQSDARETLEAALTALNQDEVHEPLHRYAEAQA